MPSFKSVSRDFSKARPRHDSDYKESSIAVYSWSGTNLQHELRIAYDRWGMGVVVNDVSTENNLLPNHSYFC